jgi:coenzyme F420 hydrogenase subunit beta
MGRPIASGTPEERLQRIVDSGLCIGCGLCQSVAGPNRIRMSVAPSGYEEPSVVGTIDEETVDIIYDVCPGVRVEGLPESLIDSGTRHDPVWGPYRSMTRAYAADPAVRFRAATGGALTALSLYIVETGAAAFVLHASASRAHPTHGERHVSFETGDVLDGAGSRYGPTAPLIDIRDVLDRGEPFAFCAKPCDIAALRNYARHDPRVDELVKFWLTPVCGGFLPPPSMREFLESLDVDPDDVSALSYRGNGCPGPTGIETRDGRVIEKNYLDMWGDSEASWSLPFRCKICPDGIGEAADIAAADAGYLTLESDIGIEEMNLYQPHQVAKKRAVWARHAGLRAAGTLAPETERLRIRDLARENPFSVNLTQARGARRRARRDATA